MLKIVAIAAPGPWTCKAPGCKFGDRITDVGKFALWIINDIPLCQDHAEEIVRAHGEALPRPEDTYSPLVKDTLRIWNTAIDNALNQPTLLRASELDVHMIVRRVNGDRTHRVIEALVAPDGFAGQGIVRTLDSHGYDQTWLFEVNGKQDDPVWILQGWYGQAATPGDSSEVAE